MLTLVNILTFLWLAAFAGHSLLSMSRGDKRSIHFPIMVHFLFCGLPLLLDELFGKPDYPVFPGFFDATRDTLTSYIYCAYVAFVPLLWKCLLLATKCTGNSELHTRYYQAHLRGIPPLKPMTRMIMLLLLTSPIFAVITSPDPIRYIHFSTTLRAQVSDVFLEGHNRVALFTRFSVIAAAVLLANAPPRVWGKMPDLSNAIMTISFMLLSIWLQGKRSLVALALVLYILAVHYRGALRGRKLRAYIVASLLILFSYSFFFQIYSGRVTRSLYENIRVDYGRDDVIKTTIYAELNPEEMRILEYRGQSFLFHLTTLVPRDICPDKPLPYAQYLTSAIFYAYPRFWGWGMTTSILEECIANVGWLGMLLAPLFLAIFCRIGDASNSSLTRLLTPLLACLLLAVELTSFYPLFLLWVVLNSRERINRWCANHPKYGLGPMRRH